MTRHSICPVLTLAVLSAFALMSTGPALASGGGGGGGGFSAPSESIPQYDAAAEYRKGIAALEAKDFKAAKTAFDHVLSVAPRDASANLMAGMARVGMEDWKGARKLFEKAVKLDGNSILAHHQLGVTYAKLGDRPKAEAELAALTASSATSTICRNAWRLKSSCEMRSPTRIC